MSGFSQLQHQSSGLNSGLQISHSVPTSAGGYQSHYGLNSLGECECINTNYLIFNYN